MPRIIARNRIPRVSIANRPITFRPDDSGGQAPGVPIGSVLLSATAPNIAGQVYEDGSVVSPQGMLRVGNYPALWAAQGGVTGTPLVTNPNSGSTSFYASAVWRGAVYSNSLAQVKSRPTPLGTPGAVLWTMANFIVGMSVISSNLLVIGTYNGGNGFLQVATDDVTRTAEVPIGGNLGGSANLLRVAFQATGAILALMQWTGPLLRSTNNGASWTAINGALSNPNERAWLAIWRAQSGAIWMVSAEGQMASSTDEGASWAVGTPPGGQTFQNSSNGSTGQFIGSASVDLIGRKGYAISGPGALVSFSLDFPMAGNTAVTAAGVYGTPATTGCPAGGLVIIASSGTRPGLWYAPFADPSAASQGVPLANFPNTVLSLTASGIAYPAPIPDGRMYFESGNWAGAGTFLSWGIPDLWDGFYRWTVTPNANPLLSLQKPYIRIK